MCIGSCIQNDTIGIESHLLYLVNQLPLNIRLIVINLYLRILCTKFRQIILKRNASINGRFTFTQQIYIGAVYYLYPHNRFLFIFAGQRTFIQDAKVEKRNENRRKIEE